MDQRTVPTGLPVVVTPGEPVTLDVTGTGADHDAAAWLAGHRDAVRAELARHGHLLVRGLGLASPVEFAAARDAVIERPAEHAREETTPRSAYGDGVFSATDLPPPQTIRLHNEDSYSVVFPGILLFCCLVAAGTGGATTLGDSRRVLEMLPDALVDRFRERGWLVTRTFTEHIGMTWQRAFGTDDPAVLESHCRAQEIGFEWLGDGRLRTTGVRSATLRHPRTGAEAWFNHVAVFNEWTHDPETRELLVEAFGADCLPQNTYYGDGEPIDPDDVRVLNDAFDAVTVAVRWRPGDLLLVDNILNSHGRLPYSGRRQVLVAMGEPVDAHTCGPSGPIGPGPRAREEER